MGIYELSLLSAPFPRTGLGHTTNMSVRQTPNATAKQDSGGPDNEASASVL